MKGDKCVKCGAVEHVFKGEILDEMIDGAPYINGLVCHKCDDKERASHAVL